MTSESLAPKPSILIKSIDIWNLAKKRQKNFKTLLVLLNVSYISFSYLANPDCMQIKSMGNWYIRNTRKTHEKHDKIELLMAFNIDLM